MKPTSTALLVVVVVGTACVQPGARGLEGPVTPTTGGTSGAGSAAAVTVTAAQLASAPIIVTPGEHPLDTRVGGTGCSAFTTSRPIATIDLRETIPMLKLRVGGVVRVGSSDGFVLRSGDQMWKACDRTGELAAGALAPGRYDVYPAIDCMKYTHEPVPGRAEWSTETQEVCHETVTPTIWVYENTMAMPAAARQHIALDNLDKPRFVEVTLASDRTVLPNEIAGRGCEGAAYALRPDLLLELPDPRKDVVIRVLPSANPVQLRSQTTGTDRSCGGDARSTFSVSPNLSDASRPSYETESDLQLGEEAEGNVALWLGSKDLDSTTVTLMISDATTKLDPLARFDGGFALDTVQRRWLGGLFPQLSLTPVVAYDPRHRRFAAAAAVYAATPNDAFIYAKRDLPAEDSAPPIIKGEPLAVLEVFGDAGTARVLTADGLIAVVKANEYVLAPPAELVFPSAPRPTIADVFDMLPPEHVAKGEAYHARFLKLAQCRDRAYAPYAARLPKVMPGYEIAWKSPQYVRIEEAGHAAQDKKCGTKEQLEAKLAPELAKLQKLVDAERARLLELAVAPHRK